MTTFRSAVLEVGLAAATVLAASSATWADRGSGGITLQDFHVVEQRRPQGTRFDLAFGVVNSSSREAVASLGSGYAYLGIKGFVDTTKGVAAAGERAKFALRGAPFASIAPRRVTRLTIPGPVLRGEAKYFAENGGSMVAFRGLLRVRSGNETQLFEICRVFSGFGTRVATSDCSGNR